MRVVNGVDCVFSPVKGCCKGCQRPQGEQHREGCDLGSRPEIAHISQYRGGLSYGPRFSALPSEMEAWRKQPWWKQTRRKTERHFLRREKELKAEREAEHERRRAAGEPVPRPFPRSTSKSVSIRHQ